MVRKTRPTRTPARDGFTLVELIVVVGIILALVSLSVAGIMKALNYQQRRNTETLVSKLDQALQKQWIRVIDTAKSETPTPTDMALANNDPRRAKVIHVLAVLKRDFPTSFTEVAVPPSWLSANQAYVRALPPPDPSPPAPPLTWSKYTPEQQSSACLYLILKQARRGGDFDPDTSLSSQEVVTDANGVKMIYDAWGKPVTFVRWPSAPLLASSTVGTLQTFSATNPPDKEDPEGLLSQSWWAWLLTQSPAVQATAGQLFSATGQSFPFPLYPVNPPPPTGTAGMQYRLTPVIWSYGSDGNPRTKDDILNFDLTP
jgi:prepilin-type N-terminal cleavage/methylation domain-containing protein